MFNELTLLEVGGEGASVSLKLVFTAADVITFRVVKSGSDVGMFEDEFTPEEIAAIRSRNAPDPNPPLVLDWQGAVRLLDECGWAWMHLYPLKIHPLIADRLDATLRERLEKSDPSSLHEWIHKLKNLYDEKW